MTIRKLQFDFPNHSNEKEKRRLSSAGEKQAAQGGFYGSRCSSVFFIYPSRGLVVSVPAKASAVKRTS
jgi:hypothetical protein